jgi:hypothetical protein
MSQLEKIITPLIGGVRAREIRGWRGSCIQAEVVTGEMPKQGTAPSGHTVGPSGEIEWVQLSGGPASVAKRAAQLPPD